MKYIIVVALFLSVFVACAQDGNNVFSFSPSHPQVGQTINVIYKPDVLGAKLKDVKEMDLQIFVYRADITADDNTPNLLEASLKQEGKNWIGSFVLDEPNAKYILFRLKSGKDIDDNNKKCWDALIYGGDDKPVQGAYLQRGSYFMRAGYYLFVNPKDVMDMDRAKADLEKEKELYPDDWLASIRLWSILYEKHKQDSDKSLLRNELTNIYDRWNTNQAAVYSAYSNYNQIGDSSKARSIRETEFKKDPKGIFAQKFLWSDIWKEENSPSQKITLMEKYFKDFPNLEENNNDAKLRTFVYSCIDAKEYDKAYDALTKMKHQDGQNYNSIAWPLIEKGEELEKAVVWAKKGVELSRAPDPATKPWSISKKNWENSKKSNLGMVLDTYAYGLMQLGKFDEAKKNYIEAYDALEGNDPDVNARYAECLVKTGDLGKAIDVGVECVKKGKDIPKLVVAIKEAIVKDDGKGKSYDEITSDKKKSFEATLAEAERIKEEESKKKREELKTKLVERRTSKPSIDFTLKDLQGNPITLSSLKGKVVVIDFWATWCGPCKQSFPILQKIFNKYQQNEKIKFLTVNSWEKQKDYNAQLENAKKFIADNKYTFPVLIDEKRSDQFDVITKYEVGGIPTQFIIDKVGNITWTNIGASPDMEDELTQQIETLLGE